MTKDQLIEALSQLPTEEATAVIHKAQMTRQRKQQEHIQEQAKKVYQSVEKAVPKKTLQSLVKEINSLCKGKKLTYPITLKMEFPCSLRWETYVGEEVAITVENPRVSCNDEFFDGLLGGDYPEVINIFEWVEIFTDYLIDDVMEDLRRGREHPGALLSANSSLLKDIKTLNAKIKSVLKTLVDLEKKHHLEENSIWNYLVDTGKI